jgi:tetratricopeptide (TPR) repeat protein
LTCLILSLPTPLCAQEPHISHATHSDHDVALGTVTFPNSGTLEAQAPFLRGLALLHSFEYEDAASAFQEAQRADATFAMAYWGEALTYAKLIWGLDDQAAAHHVLNRLALNPEARLERAGTERERSYGAAVEALYRSADLATRTRAFADSLRTIRQRYPGDLEATAFASLALQMALASNAYTDEERQAVREEAVTLAELVFASLPNHPGGAHYLIHATDHPAVAQRGLAAARVYARIAPDAEHALHMPSHIFLQLGMWDDVVNSNERAWAASRAWVTRRVASATDLDFHALAWLQYGYLQQGRRNASLALIDTARAVLKQVDLSTSGAIDARYVIARLQFMHAIETDDWNGWSPVATPVGLDTTSERARFFASNADYQLSIAAALRGDTIAASAAEARFAGRAVVESQLQALRAHARGEADLSLGLLEKAAIAEARVPHSGPPNVIPSHELYGAALMARGSFTEAAEAYEEALLLMPNRSNALLGAARAYSAAGNRQAASAAYRRLLANLHAADPGLRMVAEAQRGAL